MKKLLYFSVIVFMVVISACKKDKKVINNNNNNNNNGTGASLASIQDSIFYYEKEDYLWYDAIPDYNTFKPRSYTGANDLDALSNELYAITQLKINPETGHPYEYYAADPGYSKYSFVDDGTTTASLGGTNGDFGFEPRYAATNDLRIKYVYLGSPADKAGLKRGYQIISINDNSNLTYDGGTNVNFVINAVYYSKTIKMMVLKPDNTTLTVNLTTTDYTVNPVLAYKVLTTGAGQKVGYIVFNSFTDLSSNAEGPLNTAFNYFISNGATDLVVDLRYNGGGSGETAAYLDNLIAPISTSGKLMYTSYFNTNMQNDNCPLIIKALTKEGYDVPAGSFKPENNQVNFSKKLTLNMNRVYFLVSDLTASSSELTINNLRPVMNVQLVGDTTYGKPVGEITIPIDKYVLFSPQEYVENSANQGGYYTGMAPGSALYPGKLAYEDVTKDFGDPTETLLAQALNNIQYGEYINTSTTLAASKTLKVSRSNLTMYQAKAMSRKFDMRKFKPMVLKTKFNKVR